MISCNKITKVFSRQVVLNSFSYDFNNTGFYLLFGESGGGKTTFLNILSGFIPFDGGSITFSETTFTAKVDTSLTENDFDYITQDAFFVDFLSVMDNMRLISDNDEEILNKLKQFKLEEKVYQITTTLSGGEKQRLAVVRSLISNKKILFLDEPTAALDEENKKAVFELLANLKDSVLIICSSHDSMAKKYADEVIEFSKEKVTADEIEIQRKNAKPGTRSTPTHNSSKIKNINYFLKQWFVSERRSKKSTVFFMIFLVLALCICVFADTPQNKLDSAIENMYKLNTLTVTTTGKLKWKDICPSEDGIKEVVLSYGLSCPAGIEKTIGNNTVAAPRAPYELVFTVLPFSKDCFRLSDKIKYGTYFTEKNQIILSAEMANAMYPDAQEKLIGEHITKTVYGLGKVDFEIVGIFDYFNDFEKEYINVFDANFATGSSYDPQNYTNLYFTNSKITEGLENDDNFFVGSSSQRGYHICFDSYKDMREYYEEYGIKLDEENKNIIVNHGDVACGLEEVFALLFWVMMPIAVFMVLFATLFYIMLKKTEFVYNNKFISVFEYSGYSKKKVISRFILLNILELIKLYVIAAAVTFAITFTVNMLNRLFVFVDFQIFSYNILIISAFLVFMILSTSIFSNILFRKVKVSSWYENILSGRDLI